MIIVVLPKKKALTMLLVIVLRVVMVTVAVIMRTRPQFILYWLLLRLVTDFPRLYLINYFHNFSYENIVLQNYLLYR